MSHPFSDTSLDPAVHKWMKSLSDGEWLSVLRELDAVKSSTNRCDEARMFVQAAALHLGCFGLELDDFLCSDEVRQLLDGHGSPWCEAMCLFQSGRELNEPPPFKRSPFVTNVNGLLTRLPPDSKVIGGLIRFLASGKVSLATQFEHKSTSVPTSKAMQVVSDSLKEAPKPSSAAAARARQLPTFEAERKLAELCGLVSVKRRATSIISDYRIGEIQGCSLPVGHFIFKGNPGTGKTTVAVLFAELFFELGLIPEEPAPEVPKPHPPPAKNGEELLQQLQQGNEKVVMPKEEENIAVGLLRQNPAATLPTLSAKLKFIQESYTRTTERLALESKLRKHIRKLDPKAFPPPVPKFYKTTGAKLASEGMKEAINIFTEYRHGCIFIDEAYQLLNDSEGRKILDLLLTEMEDYRSTLIVILAGYNRQIDDLLSTNPGFCSRIAPDNRLQFDDYGKTELRDVLLTMVASLNKNPDRAPDQVHRIDSETTVTAAVNRLSAKAGSDGFGNARDVRNMVEAAVRRQRSRIAQRHGETKPFEHFVLRDSDILGTSDATHVKKVLSELDRCVGIESAKKKLLDIAITLLSDRVTESNGEPLPERIYHRCVVGKPGVGKTTIARIYADLLYKVGVCTNPVCVETTATELKSDHVGGSKEKVLKRLEEADGGVLFIDEAYAMGNKSDPYFEEIVTTLVGRIQGKASDRVVLVLAGYKEEMVKMLNDVNPGLKRRVQFDDRFELDDFTEQELHLLLRKRLEKNQVYLPRAVADIASQKIEKKRQGLNFGNAGEVENLAAAILSRRESRRFGKPKEDPYVTLADVLGDEAVPTSPTGGATFDDFSSLVEWRERIKRRIRNERMRGLMPKVENLYFIFKGPPGTGKTTAARLIGTALVDLGILSDGRLVEKSVSEMQTGYVGQAGLLSRKILDEALGGVLFIDEAYRLVEERSFGKEVLNELVSAVTETKYRGKVAVVLAGYSANMDNVLRANVGLARRFSEVIHFHNFNGARCAALLRRKCHEDCGTIPWPLTASDDELTTVFEQLAASMGDNFGNAGSVINIFEGLKEEDGKWDIAAVRRCASRFVSPETNGADLSLREENPFETADPLSQGPPPATRTVERVTTKAAPARADPTAGVEPVSPVSTDTTAFFEGLVKTLEAEQKRIAAISPTDASSRQYHNAATADVVKKLDAARANAAAAKKAAAMTAIKSQLTDALKHVLAEQLAALVAAKEAAEREAKAQTRLKELGICPAGFHWIDAGSQYRCAGGSHTISKAALFR